MQHLSELEFTVFVPGAMRGTFLCFVSFNFIVTSPHEANMQMRKMGLREDMESAYAHSHKRGVGFDLAS